MLELQGQGCRNINFVTPSHVIPHILEALPLAVEGGLRVPLVYNTGGYDRVAALKLLEGIVDIYMPDFKFWDASIAKTFCDAFDYPERAKKAIREMHRQVGDLRLGPDGAATRGLLVRHLVMPEGLAGSRSIMEFLARELSPNTYLNLLSQYHPCGEAMRDPRTARRITPAEYEEAVRAAEEAGLKRLDGRSRSRPRALRLSPASGP
jgi:putative pyruvate formate lyase activating enzyme